MDMQDQSTQSDPNEMGKGPSSDSTGATVSSGDQLVEELGRLGRKFVELLETAWNSEQRRLIEQDVRKGLADVSASLESGLKDISEKEKTKEFVGKAEAVADNVGDKVRTSDIANELARGLSSGLATLANELDKLTRELRASQADAASQTPESRGQPDAGQDIPISNDDKQT